MALPLEPQGIVFLSPFCFCRQSGSNSEHVLNALLFLHRILQTHRTDRCHAPKSWYFVCHCLDLPIFLYWSSKFLKRYEKLNGEAKLKRYALFLMLLLQCLTKK